MLGGLDSSNKRFKGLSRISGCPLVRSLNDFLDNELTLVSLLVSISLVADDPITSKRAKRAAINLMTIELLARARKIRHAWSKMALFRIIF